MYIFGGHDIKEGSLDNLWMLDLSKLSDQYDNQDSDRVKGTNGETAAQSEKKVEWVKLETTGKDKPG